MTKRNTDAEIPETADFKLAAKNQNERETVGDAYKAEDYRTK